MKGVTRPCADFAESKDVDAKAIASQHRACAKTDFYGSFDFWEVAGFSRQRGRVRFPHGSLSSRLDFVHLLNIASGRWTGED